MTTSSPDNTAASKASDSSYGQILKSSSIVGSAQVLVFAISLIKTKVAAVLLGPAGVGLVGLYQALVGLFATVAGMGLNTSGVREIAEADSSGDGDQLSRAAKTLLRLSLLTGALGCLLMVALAWPLSQWTFDSDEYVLGVAILSSVIIFGTVSAAQAAILQGLRRVSDLARINLGCALVGSLVSVAFYAWLRERGIVPALIVTAVLALGIHWWYLRCVSLGKVCVPWSDTFTRSGPLLRLGLAMAWSGLLFSGVTMLTRALIVREYGLDANGYYQAAWTISGLFSGVLLGAMGTDFFPRLTAAGLNSFETNKLVNEQTEIAMLLALPAIVGTILFSPLLIEILFSSKFAAALPLLPWLMCGVFVQMVVWPLGYIFLARGAARAFAVVETAMNLFHAALVLAGLYFFGLIGVAAAFAVKMAVHTGLCLIIFKRWTGFAWNATTMRILKSSVIFLVAAVLLEGVLSGPVLLVVAAMFTVACGIYCLRGLDTRLESGSKIKGLLRVVPFMSLLLSWGKR